MKIGYACVSSDDQSLDLQRDALKQAGCERIYKESGGKADRPELLLLMKALRAGEAKPRNIWLLRTMSVHCTSVTT